MTPDGTTPDGAAAAEPSLGALLRPDAAGGAPAAGWFADEAVPENVYQRAPLQVTLYDCVAGRPLRSFMFLGKVPSDVLAAARRGAAAGGRTTWGAADRDKLAGYYGKGWEALLTPSYADLEPEASGGADSDDEAADGEEGGAEGGADADGDAADADEDGASAPQFDFGDLRDLNALDEDEAVVIAEDDIASELRGTAPAAPRPARVAPAAAELYSDDAPTDYSDHAAFPNDTYADLRDKVYLATGVPPYAQHLFWPAGAGVETTYALYESGIPRPVDIRQFGRGESLHIAGVPVDRELHARVQRGDVFIEALDSFRRLGGRRGPLRRVFVVDLGRTAAALGGPQWRTALAAAARDTLRAEYLYEGFVLKYWPMLTLGAMQLYFESPDLLAEAYPRLALGAAAASPAGFGDTREALRARYAGQRELLHRTYAKGESVARRYGGGRALAVTAATVDVPPAPHYGNPYSPAPEVRVDVRNALDLFATSARWPAAAARFFLGSATGRSRQDVTAVKLHLSAAPGGHADAAEIHRLVGRTLRRSSLVVAVRRGDLPDGWIRGRPQLVVFTLFNDGSYSLEASWPEDERLDPDEVVARLRALVEPLVRTFNGMGRAVFPLGGELQLPAAGGDACAATLRNMTVSAYWPRALTEDAFRQLKSRWREYERAGLVAVRGLHQAGAFAFRYCKGVVAYDPRAIERAIIVSVVTDPETGRRQTVRETVERTQNTYRYLVDDVIAQRWDYLYGGRLVRFHHRTTDVKVEMAGVTADELREIWQTAFVFFDGLAAGSDRVAGIFAPGQAAPGSLRRRGLRALQDSDPELYDLRKHDARATVYSVLCQNPRPPAVFSPQEAEQMPARRRGRLVKYWNYTEGRPAFYECPNPSYPHLSFLEGRHPLGYCLPCCQKTVAHPGSRRDRINAACLAEAEAGATPADDVGDAGGRHILAYGKRVAPGRTATLSRALAEGLLFDTLEAGAEYRLYGVPQSLPALPQAAGGGFFFALAEAVGVAAAEAAEALAWAAGEMGERYRTLAQGRAGDAFGSASELADALRVTFGGGDDQFTPFSPGAPAHAFWEPLLEQLFFICYDVLVVVFEDPDGGSTGTTVNASALAVAQMQALDAGLRYCVVFKVGQPEGKRGAGGIYPLVIQRSVGRGQRRVDQTVGLFETGGEGAALVAALREVVLSQAPEPPAWNLDALGALLDGRGGRAAAGHPKKATKLVNRRGLCYAAVLAGEGGPVYVPLAESPHSPRDALSRRFGDGAATRYGVWEDSDLGAAAATGTFVRALLRAVEGAAVDHTLVDGDGAHVGLSVRFADGRALYFYHRAAKKAADWGGPAEPLVLPVMPNVIDATLWDARPGALAARPLSARALGEMYLVRLRQLLLSQLATHVYGRLDAGRRKALGALVQRAADAGKGWDVDFGVEDPKDRAKLQRILGLAAGSRTPRQKVPARFAALLDRAFFEFDAAPLRTVQAEPTQEGSARALRALLDPITERRPFAEIVERLAAEGAASGGIFSGCGGGQTPPSGACEGGRLLVPDDRYEAMVSLLAAELRSAYGRDTLILHAAGVFSDLDFIRRPGEKLEIRI